LSQKSVATYTTETMPIAKTRVVYIGPPLALSGSTMVMLDVLNHLDRTKYEPHLILRPGSAMDAAHLLKDDVVVHDTRNSRTWWSRGPIADHRFKKYIINMIRTDRPDVFIVDHRKYNYLFADLKKRHGIKVINRVGTIVSWRLKQINDKSEHNKARRLLPYSDAIVVPSMLAKQDLVDSFGIDESKIKVMYNALDLDKLRKYNPEELNYTSNARILLSVGALDYGKSPMLLLQAFHELHSQNNGIELWFVGDGDERGQLKKYIKANNLEDSVRFWGWQKNPYKFFKHADVFVYTSQMDGFGIALMEAAYFNLPIVYADTLVGAKELLQKYNIGYPFDISSKKELIENIKIALEQPKKKYFDLLKSDISIDNFIKKIEEVIDETLVGNAND
jgi:glycosyltransferase involved in cell wall biosynthesis